MFVLIGESPVMRFVSMETLPAGEGGCLSDVEQASLESQVSQGLSSPRYWPRRIQQRQLLPVPHVFARDTFIPCDAALVFV